MALSVSRFHWLLYFLPFLTLIGPLPGSAPTRGLGIAEIPHGPIGSALLSIQRLHYAWPFAVTNGHHPTHNRHPTTTTYSDKNDHFRDDMDGAQRRVAQSWCGLAARPRFIPMLHSAVLRMWTGSHVHRELLPAGLTSTQQHLGI